MKKTLFCSSFLIVILLLCSISSSIAAPKNVKGVLKIGYWSKVPTDPIQYFLHPNGRIKAYNTRSSLMGSDLTDNDGYYSISWDGSYQWYYVQFNYVSDFVKVYEFESENEYDDLYQAVDYFLPGWGGKNTINFELHADESNVFYHVNKAHNYYKNTFNYNSMDYQVKVVLKVGAMHNAAINEDDEMIFGSADGVQWARFSDVIYHEYFHLVHRKLIGSAVYNYLTEGLADYFACTINDDPNYGENTASYNNRQLLNTIQYTPGANQYLNGQALSGACWDIREELGSAITDQLVFKALQLNPNPSSIAVFADNVKKIDFQYYNSSYQNIIVSAFANHGITVPIPSAPQNLQVVVDGCSPKLTWIRNSEQNVSGPQAYSVYRNNAFLSYVSQTSQGITPSYKDTDIYWEGYDWGSWGVEFTYTVKTNDIYKYTSSASNAVTISVDPNNSFLLKRNGHSLDANIISYKLFDNYPNPFNPNTLISYQLPENIFVNLIIYNSLGQEIVQLVNKQQSVGKYTVTFNANNLPSGVYIYKLQAGEFSSTKKMLLTK